MAERYQGRGQQDEDLDQLVREGVLRRYVYTGYGPTDPGDDTSSWEELSLVFPNDRTLTLRTASWLTRRGDHSESVFAEIDVGQVETEAAEQVHG